MSKGKSKNVSANENKDEALDLSPSESAYDLTDGDFDRFELKKGAEDLSSDGVELAAPFNERFPLARVTEEEDDAEAIDISSPALDEENFPLKGCEESDCDYAPNTVGDMILPPPPKKSVKASLIYTAVALGVMLALLFVWIAAGFIYIDKYNDSLYSRFCKGVDPQIYNYYFDCFITLDGVTSPVVKSEKEHYFESFNGIPFYPGTLTSADSDGVYTVTGSPQLLPETSEALVGKTVTVERVGSREEYTVTSVSDKASDTAELIICAKGILSQNGITLISAEKSTPSQ